MADELRATLTGEELGDPADYLQALFEEDGPGPRLVADLRSVEGGSREGCLAEAWLTVRPLLRALGRE